MTLLSTVVARPALSASTVTTQVKPSNDAYVVADLNDTADKLGFRSLNTGNLPILKVWYAWNLTIVNKTGSVVGYVPVKIVSVTYFKFDLSSISGGDTVTNATLKLYSSVSNLTGASRFLIAYYVPNNSWSQSSLDWYNAPAFHTRTNSSVSITNGAKGWYSLDLTRMAQNATGKTLSVAMTFLVLYKHNEEQVVFNSTRAAGDQPYLVVQYIGTPPFSLGSAFDFSQGLNSDNVVGLVVIIAILGGVGFFVWRWSRRGRGGAVRPQKPARAKPEGGRGQAAAGEGAAAGAMAKGAKCPNCGAPVESDFKVCPNCSRELAEKVCGNCGKSMKMEFKVCPYCGNKTG